MPRLLKKLNSQTIKPSRALTGGIGINSCFSGYFAGAFDLSVHKDYGATRGFADESDFTFFKVFYGEHIPKSLLM